LAGSLVGVLASGCAGPEKKFGRGMNNLLEIVRMGDMRRTMEQTALFDRRILLMARASSAALTAAWPALVLAFMKSSLSRSRPTTRYGRVI